MAKAVSIKVSGAEQDVLLGTVLGTLPMDAPSYNVEVALATTDSVGDHTFTLLVNGVAVMERSAINTQDREAIHYNDAASAKAFVYQTTEPRSNNPVAFFNCAPGSKLTLNTYGGSGATAFVYVKAEEADQQPGVSPVGHQGVVTQGDTAAAQNLNDILLGTPIGNVPLTANVWQVTLELALVVSGKAPLAPSNIGANITLLADSDTVAENFIVPVRTNNYHPEESMDEIITMLVTGGTKLTLNYFATKEQQPTYASFVYRVFAVPVG